MGQTMTVQRSTTIDANPDAVFALLDDFRQWPQWSPWEALDPNMTHTYSGAESGVGAIHEWSGNKKAGQGKMEITGSEPPRSLDLALTFVKPFKSENTTRFELNPTGEHSTTVNWTMVSPMNLMMRVFGIFKNLDKLIGGDFEKGLAQLKSLAER